MTMPGRVMALDMGDVRIGVAISDPLRIIAQPHSVIRTVSPDEDLEALRKLVQETETTHIVVGLPVDQRGEPGAQARKVLEFVERLRGVVNVEITTQDERYSTVAAERMLIEANMRRKKRKQVIDKIAAQHILQIFLDRTRRTGQTGQTEKPLED